MPVLPGERARRARALADAIAEGVGRASRCADPEKPEVMSTEEVASFLGVSRKTVDEYADKGWIPHQRLGRRKLFSRTALMAWLAECKTTSRRRGR